MTESFVLLSALGGECVEDMEKLRQDKGLETMLGYQIPAAETARQWLHKFHDEELMSGRRSKGLSYHLSQRHWLGYGSPIDR